MAPSDAELDDLEFTALNQNWQTCKTFLNQIKERQNSGMSEKVQDLVASINNEIQLYAHFTTGAIPKVEKRGERVVKGCNRCKGGLVRKCCQRKQGLAIQCVLSACGVSVDHNKMRLGSQKKKKKDSHLIKNRLL